MLDVINSVENLTATILTTSSPPISTFLMDPSPVGSLTFTEEDGSAVTSRRTPIGRDDWLAAVSQSSPQTIG